MKNGNTIRKRSREKWSGKYGNSTWGYLLCRLAAGGRLGTGRCAAGAHHTERCWKQTQSDGHLRGFAFGGLLVGMTCYYLLLSRLIVHCQVWIWKKILGILGKVLGFFVRPVWKTLKKVGAFCGKRLKKFVRAVKIGLCKL